MLDYRISIFGALQDSKFNSKIEPLIALDTVSRVYLFRRINCLPDKYQFKIKYSVFHRKLPKKLFFIYSFFRILLLCLNKKTNCLVSVYFYPYGLITSIIQKISGVPSIHFLTGTDMRKILGSKKGLKMLKSGMKIIVRGEHSKTALRNAGIPEKKILILNNHYVFREQENNSAKKIYDIIFIGYLRPLKRLDILIEVVSKLQKRNSKLKCIIIGDGPLRRDLEQEVLNRGLTNNIHFMGYQSDIYEYLNSSKMLLLTSESEGLPMVIIEAMSCGLPVVVPAINDIPDVVFHDINGYLVSQLNVSDFSKYVSLILENSEIYNQLSINARNFTKEFCKKSTLEYLKQEWARILN